MTNPDHKVSIVMAVYNSEEYLHDAICSVINQTYNNWELICVNDGSTDSSLTILKEYEKKDKRIICIDQKHSGTPSAARNKALEYATGDFYYMLDSDDILSNDCIQKSLNIYNKTKADIVITDVYFFSKNIANVTKSIIGVNGNRDVFLTPSEAFNHSLNWGISGMGLTNINLIKRIRFDENSIYGDEFTSRVLFLNSNKIAFSCGRYYYRQHNNSTTKAISIKLFDSLKTNSKLLKLAEEYKLDNTIVYKCKKKVLNNIFESIIFYKNNIRSFNNNDKKTIQNTIKSHLKEIDYSFFSRNEGMLKYCIKRLITSNFAMLNIFATIKTI